MSKKYLLIPILMILGLLALVVVKNWNSDRTNRLLVSGNIEVDEVEISFKLAGRVIKREVDEGYTIKAGQIVAVLEYQELLNERDMRKAELVAAQARLKELQSGSLPQDVAQALSRLQSTQAEFERIRSDDQRQQTLFKREVISAKEYDASRASFDVAKANLEEAQKNLELLQTKTNVEKIKQAEAQVEQAAKSLAIAQTRLGYAILRSPVSGYVLSKNIDPGEFVNAGTPIVTAADLTKVWVRAYVNETDLGKVKLGQRVNVTTDSYPDKVYEGRITFIAGEAEFTPKTIQTEKERVKLVYRIKVDIYNPEQELKPGMPADGEILLTPEASA